MQEFRQECRRILKDGGKVVIAWNTRDFGHDVVEKDYEARKKYSVGDAKGLSSAEKSIDAVGDFFLGESYEALTFANDLQLGRSEYIGMNLSRSYSPAMDKEPEKYHGLVFALGEIFDRYSNNGILLYPHITKAYIGRLPHTATS